MRNLIFILAIVVAVAALVLAVSQGNETGAGESVAPPAVATAPTPLSTAPVPPALPEPVPSALDRDRPAERSATVATLDLPPPDAESITSLRTVAKPLDERLAIVTELQTGAARGDAMAAATLLAVGLHPSATAVPALQALGDADPSLHARILRGLQPHLASPEASVVMAALEVIGRFQDPASIATVDAALAANRDREDGFTEHVLETCARALAGIGDPRAIPILARELRWVGSTRLQSEVGYGSELVEALRCTGTTAAIAPLEGYATALRAARPDSGPRRVHIDQRLQEVDEAIAALRRLDN